MIYEKDTHVLFCLLILVFLSSVFATVGGPTYIYNLKYNPVDESVYFISNSYSGRGCLPELMKISLNTNNTEDVYPCDKGENFGNQQVNADISKITNDFKDLQTISLKDNRIEIDVSFVNYEKFSPEIDEIKDANFIASVYQDGKKIIDLPVKGCNLEQPFIFGGYSIPGFEKKIILLLSTKGNCFEGGYTNETLHVVGGINNLDKTYTYNSMKESSGLVPSEATLVVFESQNIKKETPGVINTELSENTSQKDGANYVIFTGIVAVFLGYFLGQRYGK